ncbi:MAG: TrkA family potassium uptake protein [Polyangiaceae bacterium]
MTTARKVLIVGLGRFGNAVAETSWSSGVDVTVVDRDPQLVEAIKSHTHAAFVADGTEQQILESLGARNMDVAVVTFGEAFESAVLAVSALKTLGVPEIVARATTSRRAEVLRAVGATRVIEVEREMGARLGHELASPSARDLLELAAQYRVVPWPVSGRLVDVSLKESGLRQRFGINVLGVRPARDAQTDRLVFPAPDYVLKQGDVCLLVAEDASMQKFIAAMR